MVARHLELRLDRVDRASLRVAGIRGPTDHHGKDAADPEMDVERVEGPDQVLPRRVRGVPLLHRELRLEVRTYFGTASGSTMVVELQRVCPPLPDGSLSVVGALRGLRDTPGLKLGARHKAFGNAGVQT